MQKSAERLRVLLAANCPAIFISTVEEERVEQQIRNCAAEFSAEVRVWSHGSPLLDPSSEFVPEGESLDPFGVLSHIGKKVEEDAKRLSTNSLPPDRVWVLRDFAYFFTQAGPKYEVSRFLRDLIKRITSTGVRHFLLVLDTEYEAPPRLATYFTTIAWDLPTRDDLRTYITARNLMVMSDDYADLSASERDVRVEMACEAALGLTEFEVELVMKEALAICHDPLDTKIISSRKKDIVKKSGVLTFIDVHEGMDSIGGLQRAKDWTARRRAGFSQAAREYGLPMPKGMLLTGIPGTGKSLMAKCLAGHWRFPLLRLDMGKVMGQYVGQSEGRLREVINIAEAVAPCVLQIN